MNDLNTFVRPKFSPWPYRTVFLPYRIAFHLFPKSAISFYFRDYFYISQKRVLNR